MTRIPQIFTKIFGTGSREVREEGKGETKRDGKNELRNSKNQNTLVIQITTIKLSSNLPEFMSSFLIPLRFLRGLRATKQSPGLRRGRVGC
jgi:hypothetical protein